MNRSSTRPDRNRRWPRLLLCGVLLCPALASRAFAQEGESTSHRALKSSLPPSGGGLASQMELLSRLQKLSAADDRMPPINLPDLPDLPQKFDPATLEKLRQALKNFPTTGGSLPDTNAPPVPPQPVPGSTSPSPGSLQDSRRPTGNPPAGGPSSSPDSSRDSDGHGNTPNDRVPDDSSANDNTGNGTGESRPPFRRGVGPKRASEAPSRINSPTQTRRADGDDVTPGTTESGPQQPLPADVLKSLMDAFARSQDAEPGSDPESPQSGDSGAPSSPNERSRNGASSPPGTGSAARSTTSRASAEPDTTASDTPQPGTPRPGGVQSPSRPSGNSGSVAQNPPGSGVVPPQPVPRGTGYDRGDNTTRPRSTNSPNQNGPTAGAGNRSDEQPSTPLSPAEQAARRDAVRSFLEQLSQESGVPREQLAPLAEMIEAETERRSGQPGSRSSTGGEEFASRGNGSTSPGTVPGQRPVPGNDPRQMRADTEFFNPDRATTPPPPTAENSGSIQERIERLDPAARREAIRNAQQKFDQYLRDQAANDRAAPAGSQSGNSPSGSQSPFDLLQRGGSSTGNASGGRTSDRSTGQPDASDSERNRPNAGESNNSATAESNPDAAASEPAAAVPGRSPQEQAELDALRESDLSFREKLQRLAARAAQRTVEQPSGGNSSTNGSGQDGGDVAPADLRTTLRNALQQTVQKTTELVDETVRGGGPEGDRGRPGSFSDGPGQPFDPSRFGGRNRFQPDPQPGTIERIGSALNDWLPDTSGTVDRMSSALTSAPAMTTGAPQLSLPLRPLALLAVVAGAFLWLRHRVSRLSDDETAGPRQRGERPRIDIRSREDVVRAFHAIAHHSRAVAADWWTHRRATVALCEANEADPVAIETLARLYEQARYQPANEPFSEQQLEEARQALGRCQP